MLKKLISYLIFKEKCSPESYLKHLKKIGCKIGDGTHIFANPLNILIDETRPWLIDIGNNVQITRNVTILTHGYDWSVLKGVYGEILGSSGKVTIGNNVFIGMNSTILKGTTIGNNVIIGANSLVRGVIPNNCVIAGNPAKIICSIEEYYHKRKDAQINEAVELVNEYYKTYNKFPDESYLREFFFLFANREETLNPVFDNTMKLIGNYEHSISVFKKCSPVFKTYKEFLDYCLSKLK